MIFALGILVGGAVALITMECMYWLMLRDLMCPHRRKSPKSEGEAR